LSAGGASSDPQPTQDDLIARCLAHDEGAWAEFLHRYQRLIYSTILKVGLPADETEDAFQASIGAIYRQLPRLRHPDKLLSWIVGISWRQAINRIRYRSKEISLAPDDPALENPLDPRATEGLADQARVELERAQQAQEAMTALPERCRRLLQYLFYEDPSPDYAEIARREGIPIGSLGPTRARCLEKLRRYFRDHGWV
jgi:RNA polymerase sigma factor (sigma-70 family)